MTIVKNRLTQNEIGIIFLMFKNYFVRLTGLFIKQFFCLAFLVMADYTHALCYQFKLLNSTTGAEIGAFMLQSPHQARCLILRNNTSGGSLGGTDALGGGRMGGQVAKITFRISIPFV